MYSLGIENYKSFENDRIELKPLTLLLGKNSSGKSSLLKLFLLIQQSLRIKQFDGDETPLYLNGPLVSMGEIENIFNQKDRSKTIKIEHEFDSKRISGIYEDLNYLVVDDLVEKISFLRRHLSLFSNFSKRNTAASDRLFGFDLFPNTDENKELLSAVRRIKKRFGNSLEGIPSLKVTAKTNIMRRRSVHNSRFLKSLFSEIDLLEYEAVLKLIENLRSKEKSYKGKITFSLSYRCNEQKNNIYVSKVEVRQSDFVLVRFSRTSDRSSARLYFYTDLLSPYALRKWRGKIVKNVRFEKGELYFDGWGTESMNGPRFPVRKVSSSIFVRVFERIIQTGFGHREDLFSKNEIKHIGPLRAHPQRHYLSQHSGFSDFDAGITRSNLPKQLKDKKLKSVINSWLEFLGVKFDVEKYDQIVSKIYAYDHGLRLDLTDVGFGYSQVLPVIIETFLAKESSLTMIEQPEIHLHPLFQSRLGELFAEAVTTYREKRTFLIETHSEYLLKKIRRLISDPLHPLKADDVALYLVHSDPYNENRNKIEKVPISDSGNFKWPSDFLELDDTMEFLNNQLLKGS